MSVRLLVNREVNISRNYNLSSSIRSCIINCQVERCGESNINHWKLSIGESWYSLLLFCDETENVAVSSTNSIQIAKYYAWIFGVTVIHSSRHRCKAEESGNDVPAALSKMVKQKSWSEKWRVAQGRRGDPRLRRWTTPISWVHRMNVTETSPFAGE